MAMVEDQFVVEVIGMQLLRGASNRTLTEATGLAIHEELHLNANRDRP